MDSSEQQTFTEDDLRQMVLRLAHEIRNPLATIQSAVQLLEHRHQPDDELLEFYDSIYTEITRIDSVLRDMQRFVRLDTEMATLVQLGQAVAMAVETERSRSQTRAHDIRVVEGPPIAVLIDARQLEAALGDLLDNALRYSPDGSPVHISWRLLDDDVVAIDFSDRGPGVAEENREEILRPFFSASTQGTGLGLNIVMRAASLAGGRLEWANREGGGARFSLLLPTIPEPPGSGQDGSVS